MKQLSGVNGKYKTMLFWFVAQMKGQTIAISYPKKVAEEGTWDPYLREI